MSIPGTYQAVNLVAEDKGKEKIKEVYEGHDISHLPLVEVSYEGRSISHLPPVSDPEIPRIAQDKLFNLTHFEEELGIPAIRQDLENIAKIYVSAPRTESASKQESIFPAWLQRGIEWLNPTEGISLEVQLGLVDEPHSEDHFLISRLTEHHEQNHTLTDEIENLNGQWAEFFKTIESGESKDITSIEKKYSALTEAYYRLYSKTLTQQVFYLDCYEQILKGMAKENSKNEEFCDQINRLINQFNAVCHIVEETKSNLQIQYREFALRQEAKTKNPESQEDHAFRQFYDLLLFSLKYTKNPQDVLADLSKNITELRQYALKHPSRKVRRALNNLSLVYNQLYDNPTNFKMLRFQLEKSLVVDAFLPEEVLEEDKKMPEHIKQICNTLEILPRLIGTFQGLRGGSILPLQQIALFGSSLNIPFVGVLPLLDPILGAYVGYKATELIQEAPEVINEAEKVKIISFFRTLEKEFSSMEELREEQNLVRGYAFLNSIDKGQKIRTDFFTRAMQKFEDFKLKLKFADWKERTVRLIAQVGIPTLMVLAVTVGVVAAFVGIAPLGIIVVSVLVGSIATIMAGCYAAYKVETAISHFLDEHYEETIEKIKNYKNEQLRKQKADLAHEQLMRFLEENREKIDELVTTAQKDFAMRVKKGRYDKYLRYELYKEEFEKIDSKNSQEFNELLEKYREEYIHSEQKNIATRMEGAAFFKTCDLTPETVQAFETHVLNAHEHLGDIKKLLGAQEDWVEVQAKALVKQSKIAKTAKEEEKSVRAIAEGVEEAWGLNQVLKDVRTKATKET